MYDRRFAALPMVGMVPVEAIESAAIGLSAFTRGGGRRCQLAKIGYQLGAGHALHATWST